MEEGKRISKRKKIKNGKEKVKDERREGKKKKNKKEERRGRRNGENVWVKIVFELIVVLIINLELLLN